MGLLLLWQSILKIANEINWFQRFVSIYFFIRSWLWNYRIWNTALPINKSNTISMKKGGNMRIHFKTASYSKTNHTNFIFLSTSKRSFDLESIFIGYPASLKLYKSSQKLHFITTLTRRHHFLPSKIKNALLTVTPIKTCN